MHKKLNRLGMQAVIAFIGAMALNAHAEEDVSKKDPARWHQETFTPQEKVQILTKEANAAYRQALGDCKMNNKGKELLRCKREAKQQLDEDVKSAKHTMKN
ncbi:hypothetical protein RGU70_06315 [Herbaspirillum sp. RTI4]|uniref:hypothetical protein n=1 Tax=Herbaspirillum sp. RTI4 TaxID=3048640 RepID=UPI002AB39473|nr:hypothetical protein [Herbaspirillum sp. RTI4]MDY7577927.1 hypothetical protein [Herbaspirillum sp. RTI4]MEA9981627.1 hypothetical protein [Herbaspirillum sp. RTI4]